MNNGERRRKAERDGRRAELFAGVVLRLKGFSILEKRYRTPGGEIDLIARRGALLIFVEVKSRRDFDDAIRSVSARARHRIGAAARLFMSRNQHLAQCQVRYDIFAVSGWRWRHLRDAWRDPR